MFNWFKNKKQDEVIEYSFIWLLRVACVMLVLDCVQGSLFKKAWQFETKICKLVINKKMEKTAGNYIPKDKELFEVFGHEFRKPDNDESCEIVEMNGCIMVTYKDKNENISMYPRIVPKGITPNQFIEEFNKKLNSQF